MVSSYGWYACLGCRDIFLSVQTTVLFLLFAFEGLAVLSGTLENHSRRYLAAFEIHCVAAMGMLFVPGYVVVFASAAIDHGSYI
jgi:hypothetical protein